MRGSTWAIVGAGVLTLGGAALLLANSGISLPAGLGLPFTDGPDVTACEVQAKSTLAAPSTYKRISIDTSDNPRLAWSDYAERVGLDAAAPVRRKGEPSAIYTYRRLVYDLAHDAAERGELGLREMVISYDGSNAYGVPIRDVQSCAFRLNNGRLVDAEQLARKLSPDPLSSVLGGRRVAKPLHYSCCL